MGIFDCAWGWCPNPCIVQGPIVISEVTSHHFVIFCWLEVAAPTHTQGEGCEHQEVGITGASLESTRLISFDFQ